MKSELKNRFKEIYGGFIVDIMSCTKLTPLQRIVLNYLCINQDNFSPSYAVIAKYCGIKKRQTAMDTIKFFESQNILCVERRNKGVRNIIHIHYDVLISYLHSPKLTSPSKVPANMTGTLQGPGVVPYRDQGGTLQGPVLLDSKNRKEIDKEMDKAPPTPPTLLLDAQTPKDLEEKPAKKKVKSKARRKPKFSPIIDGNDFSGVFAYCDELKPKGWNYDPSGVISLLTEYLNKYTAQEIHVIVKHYRDKWVDLTEDEIKVLKKAKKPYKPSQIGIRPYFKNPKWKLKEELENLNRQNDNNPSGMRGIEERDY